MRARILTLVALLLAGCSSVPSLPYKIEVQQGNVITQEMVDKLKPGMTRSQVRFVLGSPMISDAFHDNRWDYVYRLEQEGRLIEQRKLVVFFEEDKLVRLGGSFSPVAFNKPPSIPSVEPPKTAGALTAEPSSVSGGELPGPVTSAVPPQGTPAQGSIAASTSEAGSIAARVPVRNPVPRQVPSQATDMGDEEADQPKE
jgi:outer membrane protein assembly factor BamE